MYHNDHSKIFYRWFWILIIMFLVAGIVAGFMFKGHTTTTTSIYSYNYTYTTPKEKFNWLLMFGVWLSGVIPASIIYAIYAHLENQERQIDLLGDIRDDARRKDKTPDIETVEKYYKNSAPADRHATWVCSRCGRTNYSYDERCTNCDNKKE